MANALAFHYGETKRLAVLAACGLVATVAFSPFGPLGAQKGLAATSAVIDILIVIGSIVVGVILRGERLTSVQIVGVVVGVAATWMILTGSRANATELR